MLLFIPNRELTYFGQLETMQNSRCLNAYSVGEYLPAPILQDRGLILALPKYTCTVGKQMVREPLDEIRAMGSWIDVITKGRVAIIRDGHIFFFHWYQLKRFNLILDYLPNPYNRETAFFSEILIIHKWNQEHFFCNQPPCLPKLSTLKNVRFIKKITTNSWCRYVHIKNKVNVWFVWLLHFIICSRELTSFLSLSSSSLSSKNAFKVK